jgi:hypothetical protein
VADSTLVAARIRVLNSCRDAGTAAADTVHLNERYLGNVDCGRCAAGGRRSVHDRAGLVVSLGRACRLAARVPTISTELQSKLRMQVE